MKRQGFSLLEVLLVLSILGVLLALSLPRLNPSEQAVAQAARMLSEQVVRARLEAIRNNAFAGVQFDPTGAGSYTVFLDTDSTPGLSPNDLILQKVLFGQGDWARVRLLSPTAPATLLFDPRGIPQDFGGLTVRLSDESGTYTKGVEITPQGRVRVP